MKRTMGLIFVAGLALAGSVSAAILPGGATVAKGTAKVSVSGSKLIITQTANTKAIIDWTSFSIGASNSVVINNGAGGVTLNRVTGSALSTISGSLTGQGSVYLVNPNGIVIGSTGLINIGGSFIASTLGLTDSNFLSGTPFNFTTQRNGSLSNQGRIVAGSGNVVLMAPNVSNSGTISAPNGDVGLLAGGNITLYGTNADGGQYASNASSLSSVVTNLGTIAAAKAELRANGGNIYALAGNINLLATAKTPAYLALDAVGLTINSSITVKGAGKALLTTNEGGTGGELNFGLGSGGFLGSLNFIHTASQAQTLKINGRPYTLLYSLNDLTGVDSNKAAGGDAGSYALAGNLNASGIAYTNALIGANGNVFSGIFEGLGHSLANLTLNAPSLINIGVFGQSSGIIRDIGVSNITLLAYYNLGGLVGFNTSTGLVQNSYSTGTVTGATSGVVDEFGNQVGGLVGYNDGGTILGSHSTAAVTGNTNVGGLVGYTNGGVNNNNGGLIANSYATGNVNGVLNVGGFVGGAFENPNATSRLLITKSYATGNVTGARDVGGFAGFLGSYITFASRGDTISNSYATGSVTSSPGSLWAFGGFLGDSYPGTNLSNVYATGAVQGPMWVGGLVGYGAVTITNSVYDSQSTGQTVGFGCGCPNNGTPITPLTTAQLQNGTLPQGFDPKIWAAKPGFYPYLIGVGPNH